MTLIVDDALVVIRRFATAAENKQGDWKAPLYPDEEDAFTRSEASNALLAESDTLSGKIDSSVGICRQHQG